MNAFSVISPDEIGRGVHFCPQFFMIRTCLSGILDASFSEMWATGATRAEWEWLSCHWCTAGGSVASTTWQQRSCVCPVRRRSLREGSVLLTTPVKQVNLGKFTSLYVCWWCILCFCFLNVTLALFFMSIHSLDLLWSEVLGRKSQRKLSFSFSVAAWSTNELL